MLADGINVPVASSCGRLFDAVAAAVGLSPDVALFEGQAAMQLEDLIDDASMAAVPYAFEITDGDLPLIEPRAMWRALLNDLRDGVPTSVMAARFHLGLANCVSDLAVRLAAENGIGTVALSGGCFQNKVLFEACVARIEKAGLTCLTQAQITTNDGGLSLGQAVVAAAREIVSKTRN
jgi:hydrogenase maturation protein HypF